MGCSGKGQQVIAFHSTLTPERDDTEFIYSARWFLAFTACNPPETRVRPPLRARVEEGKLDGKLILLFETDWSMEACQLTDGRYLLRKEI